MKQVVIMVALGLLLGGCDRDKAPSAQQATEALGSARDDIARAKTSIDAIEKQSGELNDKIKSQVAELNAVVEKRLALLRQHLKEDEERLARLPAPQENELRPRLAALEKSLATFSEARRDLEAKLQPT